jgi:hypothetical protein
LYVGFVKRTQMTEVLSPQRGRRPLVTTPRSSDTAVLAYGVDEVQAGP